MLGAWLLLAPYALGYPAEERAAWANDFWAGIAIVLASSAAMMLPAARFANTFLGIWLTLSPFVLGYSSRAPVYNDVAVGLLVVLASLRRVLVRLCAARGR